MDLHCISPDRLPLAQSLAATYGHTLVGQPPAEVEGCTDRLYWLELGPRHLCLRTHGKHGAVYAEFAEEGAKHRREQGGGRGQPIAKAVGLKGLKQMPKVCDATAGLGRDSIVLAAGAIPSDHLWRELKGRVTDPDPRARIAMSGEAKTSDDRIVAYTLEAENFESIHNHSAYALIERDKRTDK